MNERFEELPEALRARAVRRRLGPVPALLAHPDTGWHDPGAPAPAPRPTVLWMHGRTVDKELDPGRYLRWLRAPSHGPGLHTGLGVCALDLPGHGERFDAALQSPDRTLEIVEQMAGELDHVIEALADPALRGAFDLDRLAIGGMSAGGMATLIRLARPHPFRCASVESTAGDFSAMRGHGAFFTRGGRDPEGIAAQRLNPINHLDAWRDIPLLALHSRADEWVPVSAIESFVGALRARAHRAGADPASVELRKWDRTGAPSEHAGFGRVSGEAKSLQLDFFLRHLSA